MKNALTLAACLFFVANIFSQELAPKPNPSALYGYDLLGTRKLVGEDRNYYGSMQVVENGPFNIKRTTTDTCFQLGELYPAMGVNGKSLFMNFDPDGTAHLTELPGATLVFVRNGRPYACACGNLLKKAIKPAAPAPIIHREKVTVYDTIHQPLVVKPMTVRLQLCTASYINGCHQQTFFHGTQEFTLETLPYDGEYVYGKKFVKEIPKTIPSNGGLVYTDYFWVTSH
jgi:hypothetical protein